MRRFFNHGNTEGRKDGRKEGRKEGWMGGWEEGWMGKGRWAGMVMYFGVGFYYPQITQIIADFFYE
jgi:hypothetical protein